MIDVPQELTSSPGVGPGEPGLAGHGFVFPAATVWSVALYGLNRNADAGICENARPFTLIDTLPPSHPCSVAM